MARLNDALDYESKYITNDVLNNKLGITDAKKLEEVERKITAFKLGKLFLEPRDHSMDAKDQEDIRKLKEASSNKFDANHYIAIHRYLFDDIYDFAGEIRNENIKKVIPFCLPNLVYHNLDHTLKEAHKQSRKIKSREDLVDFITELYPELDIIHPFREGNGRVEREFLRQYTKYICKTNNLEEYTINYDLIDDKDNFINSVIIADARCNTAFLREYVDTMVVNVKEKETVEKQK